MDTEGREIKVYDPGNHSNVPRSIRLSDNEELIGVYGVYGTYNEWFDSFGFIVKVKKTC